MCSSYTQLCLLALNPHTHTHTLHTHHTHTHTAKPVVSNLQSLRLCADDFETIELIGKGAFGEVKVQYPLSMHSNHKHIIHWA